MSETKHTPTPWKVVSDPHFDSGLVYTSIQPVNVDEDAMKPLAMANGEYHVCRMSHTAAPWRFNYHRANAVFIVEAVNSHASLVEENRRLTQERDKLQALYEKQGVEAFKLVKEWQARAEKAEAETRRLREALEPFAAVAEYDIGEDETDNDVFTPMTWVNARARVLTVGDFRRARAALQTVAGKEG